jgi:hypothetical protein
MITKVMVEVPHWKTSDGQILGTFEGAAREEIYQLLQKKIYSDMDREDVIKIIFEERVNLCNLLMSIIEAEHKK